jgi:lysophospholipase L1-like esterase
MDQGRSNDRDEANSGAPSPSIQKSLFFAALLTAVFFAGCEAISPVAAQLLFDGDLGYVSARSDLAQDGWRVDPLLGWAQIPNIRTMRGRTRCVTNSLGLRDREFSREKPPGELRILSVGDSTVLGYGVEEDETFSSQLERKLNASFERPVEVINAGIPGYSSEQARLYLERRGLELGPDVVILETNYNDRRAHAPSLEPDSEAQFRSAYRHMTVFELLNKSTAVRLLRRVLRELGVSEIRDYDFDEIAVDTAPRVSLERYEQNVRRIIEVSREAGASVILVGLPDQPAYVAEIVRAEAKMNVEKWWDAERALIRASIHPHLTLLAQRMTNELLEKTGRSDEIRPVIPVPERLKTWKSTDGYAITSLSDPYIAVLERIGEELDVPVVIPRAPAGADPASIQLDYIHLNPQGHEILASQLAEFVAAKHSPSPRASGSAVSSRPGRSG